MTLMTRLASLLRADMHAVLDRIEEPEALLRQALREMGEALVEDQQHARCLELESERNTARRGENGAAIATAAAEIERALTAGREDLARASIRKRLEHEALAKLLERRARELAQRRDELGKQIAERTQLVEAMRQKAELLAREGPPEQRGAGELREIRIRDEDVELALLAERERRAAS